jgi:MraZ protein
MDGLLRSQEVSMSAPFRGRFDIKIDDKFRFILPAAYRGSARLVVTNSQFQNKRCLDVYTWVEWQKLESRIAKLPPLKAEVQSFQRFYLSGGHPLEVDGQNRLLIPPSLRQYAGLQTEAVLVGLGAKFEIWDLSIWSTLFDTLASEFPATLEAVSNLPEKRRG